MSRRIELPPRPRLRDLGVDPVWTIAPGDRVVLDDRRLVSASPGAVAALGAWAARVREHAGEVVLEPSGSVARRSMLANAVAEDGAAGAGDVAPGAVRGVVRFVERVRAAPEIARALAAVVGALGPDPDQDAADASRYVVSELLRNVFEHADSRTGAFVVGAWRRRTRRLILAIADAGISIPAHVRRRWPAEWSDTSALRSAIEAEVSGSTDRDRNAGLGLFMALALVRRTHGNATVRSGGATMTIARGGEPSVRRAAGAWPGTTVAVAFDLRELAAVDVGTLLRMTTQRLHPPGKGVRHVRSRDDLSSDAVHVAVGADAGGLGEDKLRAAAVRDASILPALDAGRAVLIDFAGVRVATQSFVHALLAAPLRRAGESGATIAVTGASREVRAAVALVASYVEDERLDRP